MMAKIEPVLMGGHFIGVAPASVKNARAANLRPGGAAA